MLNNSVEFLSDFEAATLKIHLNNLKHNYRYFRSILKKNTKIMAMIKADAYGCGSEDVAKALEECDVDYLGVAYTKEGIYLRQVGIKTPIMVMNPLPGEYRLYSEYQLEPEMASLLMLRNWMSFISSEDMKSPPIHVKIDTGMHRSGVTQAHFRELIHLLKQVPFLNVKSVFSHLSSSSDRQHDHFTQTQFDLFEEFWKALQSETGLLPMRHILNSAGICRFPDHQYEMVRLGIGLFGVGLESLPDQKHLLPVQSLTASVLQIKDVPQDGTIGYGRGAKMASDGRIATLNLGYADGLPRSAGERPFLVQIGTALCPVLGQVCMDITMVDVSDYPEIKEGAIAEIYGINHPIIHLAKATGTIPYEILCGNHHRLRKVIVND